MTSVAALVVDEAPVDPHAGTAFAAIGRALGGV